MKFSHEFTHLLFALLFFRKINRFKVDDFHVCCWAKQIRLSQTDLIGPGLVKSILCITLFQLINFCLVLLTPSSGVILAIQRCSWIFRRGW